MIGVGLKEVELPAEASELVNIQSTTAVEVTEVTEGSAGEAAGLIVGDVIVVVDGLETSSTEAAVNIFTELPLRISRQLLAIRNGELLTLKIRIQVREWEASGMKTLLTVGRFAVFGLDGAGRLVAIDRKKGEAIGVSDPTGFSNPVINSRTDQIYLATSTGRVICIREIGPTITVPEFTPLTQFSTVTKMHVKVGDLITSDGTPLCDVVVADGSTYTVSSNHAGIVQRLMIREGSSIMTDSKILRIADDQFATYHQRPQQRPVDVDLGTGQSAQAPDGP